jgi:hypothetical protein
MKSNSSLPHVARGIGDAPRFAMRGWGTACSVLAVATVIVVVAVPSSPASADPPADACEAWDVEYALAASLRLSETPMGAGDGNYNVGPGTAVLRFEREGVRLRAYTMRARFSIESHAAFLAMQLLTDASTTTTPDACGDLARGELDRGTVSWGASLSGYRTDGTVTCDGSLCGRFGAPPPGQSGLHIPPHEVRLGAFHFSPDMRTFTMASTWVAHTDSPKQTAHVALSGREVRSACVHPSPCP